MKRSSILFLVLTASVLAFSTAAAEGIAIGGRVLVPGGAPLPEADVQLLPLLDPLGEVGSVLTAAKLEPVSRALTDSEGRFRIEAPHAGLWTVRVQAPGFAPLETDLKPLIEPVELPDAELTTDTGMKIKIKSADGSPVPGALVLLRSDLSRIPFFRSPWNVPLRSGRTDAEGKLRLPRGEGERSFLSASAPDFAHGEMRGLRGTAATLTLDPGMHRQIEVRSGDGRPVAGVMVMLGKRPHPFGTTDTSGKIVVNLNPSKPTPVSLLARDGRQLEAYLEVPPTPTQKPERLDLPDQTSLLGRLIDADSRRPIDGGVVWDMENPAAASVTGRGGGFSLNGPYGRRMEIIAGAPGYMSGRPFAFQLGTGRPGPVLALRPAAAIEGIVLDPDGSPVAGAEAELKVQSSPGHRMRIEIGRPTALPRNLSGSAGTFRLSPLDPEKDYRVKVRAEGFAPAEEEVSALVPYETRSGVKVSLVRGQSVVGSLVDPSGLPVRDAMVKLKPGRSRGSGMIRVMDQIGGSTLFEAFSDNEGKFRIDGVSEGKFDLEARRAGFAKRSISAIEIQEALEPLDLGEITLEPGERVQGLVRDSDGQPIEGVEVFASGGGGPMMTMMMVGDGPGPGEPEPDAVTDPTGWFVVNDLAPGKKYTFRFVRTGFVNGSAGPFQIPRAEPIEASLDPSSKVAGQVLTEGGEPIAGAQINLTRSRTIEMGGNVMKTVMMMSESSDGEGRFVFEEQEPGTISLKAVASGYQEAKLDNLEIPKGEDLEGIEFPLDAGSIVTGQVLAPDGRPAIGASVRLAGDSGDGLMRMMGGAPTDGDGIYLLEGLAPGKISVEASHPDYVRTVRDLEVKEGPNSLDLNFEGGVQVAGRVLDVEGRAVVGAIARLVPAGRFMGGPETKTQLDGSFTMPGVQDGDYRLWVEARGYAASAGKQQVTVAGQPVEGLEVELDPGAVLSGRVTGLEPEEFVNVGVRAEGESFGGFDSHNVDYEGNYRIENLLPGNYDVVAELARSGKQAKGQVTVEPGASQARLDLQFGTGLTLSGRAVQGDKPIAGATVYVDGLDIDHSGWNETDHDGLFSIEGLEAGSYEVHLRHWQTGLAYDKTVELATSREVVLEVPTAHVGGRIVDVTDRQSLSGVSLTLTSEESGTRSRLPIHTATTDLEGKFEFGNVADGTWKLAASKKGYAALSRPVSVQYERAPEDLRISMDPTEGVTIEARLPSGAPPSELRVAVLDPAGGALVTGNYATGENGRVRLSSVPPGTWTLVLSAAGSATTNMSAQSPGATIPVRLEPASGLRVVVPELSQSSTIAMVSIRDGRGRSFHSLSWDGRPQNEWRMSGGRLEFGSLPPGGWSVTVAAADGRSWQGDSVTAAGATAELVLE